MHATLDNLAFAIAGLPYVGCVWWVSRCLKQAPKLIEIENYRLVEFIRRSLESIKDTGIVQFLAMKIRALPKDDYLRTRLAENWADFKEAIGVGVAEGCKPGIPTRGVPCIIASNFYKNSRRPKTAVDRLFAEQERQTNVRACAQLFCQTSIPGLIRSWRLLRARL